jgi:polyhydroxybutyrate depolymerase
MRDDAMPTRAGIRLSLGVGLALLVATGTACTRSDGSAPSDAASSSSGSGSGSGSGSSGSGSGSGSGESDTPSVAPDPSGGCDSSTAGPGDETVAMGTSTPARQYLRHIPADYDGTTPMPLVLDIHGYANAPEIENQVSGMPTLGDTEGFVTVTPVALGAPAHWDTRLDSPDIPYIRQVLDDVEADLCVDRNRVYATGYSSGAFMTSTLACALSDRLAAVAPVAGLRDVPDCQPSRAVPAITFHGTEDTFMLYTGGVGPGERALPAPDGSGGSVGDVIDSDDTLIPGDHDQAVPDSVSAWADRNGCDPEPDEGPVADDVGLVEYTCPPGADVLLYRVRGGGHTWPGSEATEAFGQVTGPTNQNLDATQLIWDFFASHPRQP